MRPDGPGVHNTILSKSKFTPFWGTKRVWYIGSWSTSMWGITWKTLQYKIGPFTWKKKRKPFLSSFLLDKEKKLLLREGGGKDLVIPIPVGPHRRMGVVERIHIAEMKDNASIRDGSMSRYLSPTASKTTYALCSSSLIRKITLRWGYTMGY